MASVSSEADGRKMVSLRSACASARASSLKDKAATGSSASPDRRLLVRRPPTVAISPLTGSKEASPNIVASLTIFCTPVAAAAMPRPYMGTPGMMAGWTSAVPKEVSERWRSDVLCR